MTAVPTRLLDAINAHDLDGFTSLFAPDYRSEHPAHPRRVFSGREQVRENWSAMFRGVPDLRADPIAVVDEGSRFWVELRIHGTRGDGAALDLRGVIVGELRADLIAAARLYLEEVEEGGEDIEQTVARRTSATSDPDSLADPRPR